MNFMLFGLFNRGAEAVGKVIIAKEVGKGLDRVADTADKTISIAASLVPTIVFATITVVGAIGLYKVVRSIQSTYVSGGGLIKTFLNNDGILDSEEKAILISRRRISNLCLCMYGFVALTFTAMTVFGLIGLGVILFA